MADANTLIDLLGFYDNFGEPEPAWNHVSMIVPLVLSFLIVTWLCVLFRLYISGTVGTICICLSTKYGMGKHFLTIPYSSMKIYLRFFYVANATYCVSTTCVKLALILQYLRVFNQDELWMRRICKAAFVFTALWGLAYSFMAWVPCFPVAGYWDYYLGAKCYAFGSLKPQVFFGTYASSSATNMFLDMVVLAIPVPLYFRKDTLRKTKLGLLALLFMGGLINFLSIWRLATVIEHKAATYPTFDPTWYGPISIQLGALEIDAATICASIPVFWPVLTAKLDQIFVTKEITIEHTHRFAPVEEDIELNRKRTDRSEDTDLNHVGTFYNSTSQESLTRGHNQSMGNLGSKEDHYKDDFILSQINPFTSMEGVKSDVVATKIQRKHSVIRYPYPGQSM